METVSLNYNNQFILFNKDLVLTPEVHYNTLCTIPSDINEHLPTLKKYTLGCETVTEMGVRYGCSTWAFIEGKPKNLYCYDINYDFFKHSENVIEEMCKKYDINFKFIIGDSLKCNIEPTDLLFIDTLHRYNQLYNELKKHSINVRKWIILHDTETFRYRDEDIYDYASDIIKSDISINTGLLNAINDFLHETPNWFIKENYTNNNGLTILERKF